MRLLLLLLALGFFSCQNQSVKKELAGTWNYDYPATRAEMEERGASQSELNYMESLFGSLGNAQLIFATGGTLEFQMSDLEQTGTWSVQEKGQVLLMDLTGSAQRSAIEYLGNDTLILVPLEAGEHNFPRVLTQVSPPSE